MTKKKQDLIRLPLLPLRDPELVVFPELLCEVDVGRPFSVEAIMYADKNKSKLIIGMQRDSLTEKPVAGDFHGYCTEAEIKSVLSSDKDATKLRIIIVGTRRGILKTVGEEHGCFWGQMEPVIEPVVEIDEETNDLIRQAKEIVKSQVQFVVIEDDSIPINSAELSKFVDSLAGQLPIGGKKKVIILGISNPKDRLKYVVKELAYIANNTELEIDPTESTGMEDSGGNESIHGMTSEIKQLSQHIEKIWHATRCIENCEE
jgi:ATP-dependent Lon protease